MPQAGCGFLFYWQALWMWEWAHFVCTLTFATLLAWQLTTHGGHMEEGLSVGCWGGFAPPTQEVGCVVCAFWCCPGCGGLSKCLEERASLWNRSCGCVLAPPLECVLAESHSEWVWLGIFYLDVFHVVFVLLVSLGKICVCTPCTVDVYHQCVATT